MYGIGDSRPASGNRNSSNSADDFSFELLDLFHDRGFPVVFPVGLARTAIILALFRALLDSFQRGIEKSGHVPASLSGVEDLVGGRGWTRTDILVDNPHDVDLPLQRK